MKVGAVFTVYRSRYVCGFLVVAVLWGLVVVSCARSGDLRDGGIPAQRAVETPLLEPPVTPPPIPQVAIEYDGNLHQGRRGNYAWPTRYGTTVMIEEGPYGPDFDIARSLVVRRGDDLVVVVSSDDPSQFEVLVLVFPILGRHPGLEL